MDLAKKSVFSILFLLLFVSSWAKEFRCGSECRGSCCEVATDDIRCCPFINGVCCSDGNSCCPQGSTCDANDFKCTYNGFVFTRKWLSKKDELQSKVEKPTLCPDLSHACPANATCCSMSSGSWGCCDIPNATCCSDGVHCCPHGFRCNEKRQGCDSVMQMNSPDILSGNLGPSRNVIRQQQPVLDTASRPVWNAMAYSGVRCSDGLHECPDGTTCCNVSDSSHACCPFANAVCCSDELHCCPENYQCDPATGRCIGNSSPKTVAVKPIAQGEQFCPDRTSVCPLEATCCLLPDKSWGCCPLPEAVCCSDGLHCCPSGYKCNEDSGTCDKQTVTALSAEVVCRNPEYQCPDGTTCCPLPNDEWACCPLPEAVCCSDGVHCCPSGTVCDVRAETCSKVTHTGLHSIPWLEKKPARQPNRNQLTTKEQTAIAPFNHIVCPGEKFTCRDNQTCCSMNDKKFGCCPFPHGVCCHDGKRCCPFGTTCGPFGVCIRPIVTKVEQSISPAHRMHSTTKKSTFSSSAFFPSDQPTQAEWCGEELCPSDGFCCPDALGVSRRKCCPAAAGVCCSDGEHCCPRGTRCLEGGKCETEATTSLRSSAPYLVPATDHTGKTADFIEGIHTSRFSSMPVMHVPARVNPMFLFNWFYKRNARKFTVCPDLERTCGLDQQCCPTLRDHFACAPKGFVCCPHTTNASCPPGTRCSQDGHFCEPA